ncbi:MAG: SH3 domain-containing protein [Bdellovibrionales bacterium]
MPACAGMTPVLWQNSAYASSANFARFLAVCTFALVVAVTMPIQEGHAATGKSGLPIPRFVSLRSDEVNMRTGPGTRYPIEWVLRRRGLPIEVTAEYDVWVRVRDADGIQGWVQRGMISGRRMAIIHGSMRNLLKDDEPSAPTVARLEIGATGKIMSCKKDWCNLQFGKVKGYLRKSEFWGAYPDELIH